MFVYLESTWSRIWINIIVHSIESALHRYIAHYILLTAPASLQRGESSCWLTPWWRCGWDQSSLSLESNKTCYAAVAFASQRSHPFTSAGLPSHTPLTTDTLKMEAFMYCTSTSLFKVLFHFLVGYIHVFVYLYGIVFSFVLKLKSVSVMQEMRLIHHDNFIFQFLRDQMCQGTFTAH